TSVNRVSVNDITPLKRTPAVDPFSTPSFLRTSSFTNTLTLKNTADMIGSPEVLQPMGLRRKPLAKGLSHLMADLRKMQDEALDEDMDLLNEIEGGRLPMQRSGPKPLFSNVSTTS